MCCRVPAAAEVEKWRLSFSNVMNSASKFYLNQNKVKELRFI